MTSPAPPPPIVVVDDSMDDVEILTRCFQRSRIADTFTLRPYHSGRDFLDYMQQVASGTEAMPTIVLLDINMPDMNGFDILRSLRSVPDFAIGPTVLFMSNSDRLEDIERAVALDSNVIPKFGTIHEGVDFFDNLVQ